MRKVYRILRLLSKQTALRRAGRAGHRNIKKQYFRLNKEGKQVINREIKQFSILCGFNRCEEDASMALTPKDIAKMLDHSTLQP
jgi:DNA-binding PadR family transcriptional regulator